MPLLFRQAEIFNRTRQLSLAKELATADSHWTRMRGLLGTSASDFRNGRALWITPCRGVHTLAMAFAIDVVYLDRECTVVHLEQDLQPWRFAPVRLKAASVLELPRQVIAQTQTAIGDKIEIGGSVSA
jgi:uncharacterized membrane protein (UPF0127 family)